MRTSTIFIASLLGVSEVFANKYSNSSSSSVKPSSHTTYLPSSTKSASYSHSVSESKSASYSHGPSHSHSASITKTASSHSHHVTKSASSSEDLTTYITTTLCPITITRHHGSTVELSTSYTTSTITVTSCKGGCHKPPPPPPTHTPHPPYPPVTKTEYTTKFIPCSTEVTEGGHTWYSTWLTPSVIPTTYVVYPTPTNSVCPPAATVTVTKTITVGPHHSGTPPPNNGGSPPPSGGNNPPPHAGNNPPPHGGDKPPHGGNGGKPTHGSGGNGGGHPSGTGTGPKPPTGTGNSSVKPSASTYNWPKPSGHAR